MRLGAYGVVVLLGASALWTMGGTERERSLLGPTATSALGALEVSATAHPGDAEATRKLAQAYLDARQPGLAVVLVASASAPVQADVRVQHVLARALLDQGHNDEALSAETRVLTACAPVATGGAGETGCDGVLLTSAVRRVGILREMLSLGVEDAQAHPEASLIAYQNATREARVSLQ